MLSDSPRAMVIVLFLPSFPYEYYDPLFFIQVVIWSDRIVGYIDDTPRLLRQFIAMHMSKTIHQRRLFGNFIVVNTHAII